MQEYQGTTEIGAYLYGPSGLVKNLVTNNYYYQDGSGSTSHLADGSGALLEWYRYDLQGTPVFYDAMNNQLSASSYSVRHLFTGQQWYSELGLYDLRNRFYSPDIGRFLQPDPIGFGGDPTNLYRYCTNNPNKGADPMGLDVWLSFKSYGSTVPGLGYFGITNFYLVVTAPGFSGGQAWYTFGRDLALGPFTGDLGFHGLDFESNPRQLSAAQDLVVRSYLDDHSPFRSTDPMAFALRPLTDANGHIINSVDRYTGNIWDAQWNYVGWEDPNTGNIYNAEGNWAGWDPKWQSNFANNSGGRGGGGGEGPSGSGGYMPSGLAGAGSPSQTELALYGGPFATGWGPIEWKKNFWGGK